MKTIETLIICTWVLTLANLYATVKAHSQDLRCGTRGFIVKQLETKFSETSHSIALSNRAQGLVEVFLSPKGTWTILRTETNGRTCIMLSGTNWNDNTQNKGEPS